MNTMLMQIVGAASATKKQGYASSCKANKFSEETPFIESIQDKQHTDVLKEKREEKRVGKEPPVSLKKRSSIIQKELEKQGQDEKLSSEELKGKLSSEIVQLLAHVLGIEPQVIEEIMKRLEYMPIQLIDGDIFKQVIKELTGEEAFNLLGDANKTKQMGQLFETIKDRVVTFTMQHEEVLAQLEWIKQGDIKEGVQLINGPKQEETMQVVAIEDVVKLLSEKQQDSQTIHLSQGSQLGDKSQLIGIHLPVQSILDSQTTRLWQQMTKETVGMMHTEHAPINKQIIDKVDLISLKDGNEMTLELAPKELGKLSLKVSEHNGIVTTTIRVDNEKTKEILMQHIEILKESLEKQGLEVGAFQVDIRQNTQQDEMQKQKQKASKRIQEIIDKQLEGMEEDLLGEEVINISTKTEVDMRA